MEHTITPAPGTIRENRGVGLGDYLAKCAYCGDLITGNDDYAFHLTDEEKADLAFFGILPVRSTYYNR
jgi:hypothetical protein